MTSADLPSYFGFDFDFFQFIILTQFKDVYFLIQKLYAEIILHIAFVCNCSLVKCMNAYVLFKAI